jgi:hypothetical protein
MEGPSNQHRVDYFASTSRFVIRMPAGFIHEMLVRRVDREIANQLQAIGNGEDNAAVFARNIESGGSGDILLLIGSNDNAPCSRHSPDASFAHCELGFPGVVIEVAVSHKNLEELAREYFLGSGGHIQAVVGIDVGYGPRASRSASLLVWRQVTTGTDDDGNELREVQLAVNEVRHGFCKDRSVTIPPRCSGTTTVTRRTTQG